MSRSDGAAAAARAVLLDYCAAHDVSVESGSRDGELVVTLPGERKLRTVCSCVLTAHDLSVSAFVMRRPDEAHAEVHAYLLRRNLRLRSVAYAVDDAGDVYAVARLPFDAVTTDGIDRLFAVMLEASDEPFDTLLRIGFATSIRREWQWRLDRGEPTGNLAAFPDLAPESAPPGGGPRTGV